MSRGGDVRWYDEDADEDEWCVWFAVAVAGVVVVIVGVVVVVVVDGCLWLLMSPEWVAMLAAAKRMFAKSPSASSSATGITTESRREGRCRGTHADTCCSSNEPGKRKSATHHFFLEFL